MDHVPALPLAVDRDLRAVGEVGDNRSGGGGVAPQVQRPPAEGHPALDGVHGVDEGQAEKLRQGPGQLLGDGVHVSLYPGGVGPVVVVADFHQHRWGVGLGHLPQGGGGAGGDFGGKRVDFPQLLGDEFRRPLALAAARVIKGDDAPLLAVAPLRRAVGVKGQVEVVGSPVGLPDRGPGGHFGLVALILDSIGEEIGDQGVRQQVHVVFL